MNHPQPVLIFDIENSYLHSEVSDADLLTPCCGLCALDRSRSRCTGCYRTLEEISLWMSYSESQKRAVIAACQDRRNAFTRPS
ncbi:MAG: DUF1289 domain-containing protein [Planctomycetota bacterium]